VYFLCQEVCNYLQRLFGGSNTALSAVSANFQTAHDNVEAAIALDLTFEAIEKIALEFHDLAAAQAGHVDVIALWTALIKMFLTLHMHEIEFVDQTMPLEKAERTVDSNAVNPGVEFARVTENLCSVEMLLCRFHDAKNRASLVGQSNPPG